MRDLSNIPHNITECPKDSINTNIIVQHIVEQGSKLYDMFDSLSTIENLKIFLRGVNGLEEAPIRESIDKFIIFTNNFSIYILDSFRNCSVYGYGIDLG